MRDWNLMSFDMLVYNFFYNADKKSKLPYRPIFAYYITHIGLLINPILVETQLKIYLPNIYI